MKTNNLLPRKKPDFLILSQFSTLLAVHSCLFKIHFVIHLLLGFPCGLFLLDLLTWNPLRAICPVSHRSGRQPKTVCKTRGFNYSFWAPDDGRCVARNMLSN